LARSQREIALLALLGGGDLLGEMALLVTMGDSKVVKKVQAAER